VPLVRFDQECHTWKPKGLYIVYIELQVDLRGVEQLAMSGHHSLAVRHSAEMFSWGANEHGVLGLGKGGRLSARQPTRVPNTFFAQVSRSTCAGTAAPQGPMTWCAQVGRFLSLEKDWDSTCSKIPTSPFRVHLAVSSHKGTPAST